MRFGHRQTKGMPCEDGGRWNSYVAQEAKDHCCGRGSIPSLGTYTYCGCAKKKKKMEVEIGLMLLYAEECLELEDTGSVRKNCALEALERTLVLPTP